MNPLTAVTEPPAHASRGIGARILHEAREAVAPTLFFALGFNIIVLTTNLLLAEYLIAFSNFMLATFAAWLSARRCWSPTRCRCCAVTTARR